LIFPASSLDLAGIHSQQRIETRDLIGVAEGGEAAMFGMAGMLVMVLVWAGLVLLVIWGAGQLFPRERRNDEEVAREALGRRFAAGEISDAEYQQALRSLRHE
jgi:putative membrane protein